MCAGIGVLLGFLKLLAKNVVNAKHWKSNGLYQNSVIEKSTLGSSNGQANCIVMILE